MLPAISGRSQHVPRDLQGVVACSTEPIRPSHTAVSSGCSELALVFRRSRTNDFLMLSHCIYGAASERGRSGALGCQSPAVTHHLVTE